MKFKNRYTFIFILFISLFFNLTNISADYTATVLNPADARCSISNTTGYCYYNDKNLNSVKNIVSLDTGDVVTVLTNYERVESKDINLCKDYYVYTSYYFSNTNKTYYGYYCNDNLSTGVLTDEIREELSNSGFPESYFEPLAILKTAHPNWSFVAINTGLNFNDAVIGENVIGRSVVEVSASNNYAYFDIDTNSFDYYNDHFNERDRIGSSNPWCDANRETIAYYMDTRNFLSDMYIFQFEGLSYDDNIGEETYKNTVSEVFKNDYLSNFVDDFVEAGKKSKVSPLYLASLSKQEVGVGENPNVATAGQYNGMYNFYNIGATGDVNPAINGLNFAANEDESTLRPWDTEYKAIVGGALWMSDRYISVGQDTSFLKKWNVVHDYLISTGKNPNPYGNYTHQYMTGIMAPSSEAVLTYRSYYNTGLLDSGFVFYIPIYNNMPVKTSLPTKGGWPNNYLSSISINDQNISGFDGGVEEYNYYLDINNPNISINATPVSSKAKVSGNGTFNIEEDTTKNIVVTAENGNVKTYKINIKLTGTKQEDPVDVQKTLNNAGIKNGDKYLNGFNVGTDILYIKEKVKSVNNDAEVLFTTSNGTEKTTGIMNTGDKVKITVGEDIKEYQIVIYGDANGDGEINAIDYVRIRKYIMNTANLSEAYKEASDVNKDGEVNAIDYVRIRKYIMNTASIEQ